MDTADNKICKRFYYCIFMLELQPSVVDKVIY